MTISRLLGPDPLAGFEHEASIHRIEARFRDLIPDDCLPKEALVLRPYIENPPLVYWDETTASEILDLMEAGVQRTFEALSFRSDCLHRGLENLHRESPATAHQEAYNHGHARDLLILANTFLPEYLRFAEHVLGNLAPVIWSLTKKGGISGAFVLKNAMSHFRAKGPISLTVGYDDRVRNAIAHGQVKFTGLDIEFGAEYPRKLSSLDFLRLFDDLVRTCVGLGLAIQLFWLRNKNHSKAPSNPPLSIVTLAAAGSVTRNGLRFIGAVESTTPLAGRQLHVALASDSRSRNQMLLESCRVARELLDQGALAFDRYLFEIDCGRDIPTLVIVKPAVLRQLLAENAPASRLTEILTDSQLLFSDEPRIVTSLRAWSKIAKSAAKKVGQDVLAEWHKSGLFSARGRYSIRDITNLSVDGIARVEIRAMLLHPDFAMDQRMVDAIVKDSVRVGRTRFVKSRSGSLDRGIPWPKLPCHVFVLLFRRDGPMRWLQRDGWAGGNLVAIGERVWGGREHVLVKKPQAVLGKIKVRYEVDPEEAASALAAIENLVADLRKDQGLE